MGNIGYQELLGILLVGVGCASPIIVALIVILVMKKSKPTEQTPPKADDPGLDG